MNTWVIARVIDHEHENMIGEVLLGSRISYQESPADPQEHCSLYMFKGPKFCSALYLTGEQLEILEVVNSYEDLQSTAEKYGINV